MSEWINVSDRLPVESKMVLISYPAYTDDSGEEYVEGVGCGYLITTVNGKYWFRSDGTTFGELGMVPVEPVAWMPMPEPYR